MFCLKCGTEASENQKFCRSCGNRLLVVPPAIDRGSKVPRKERNAVTRVANNFGLMGAWVLATSLAIWIIATLVGDLFHWMTPEFLVDILRHAIPLALILVTMGVFLKIVGWVMRPESNISQDERQIQVETAKTNQLAPGERQESISSVTERTTNLLEEKTAKEEMGR